MGDFKLDKLGRSWMAVMLLIVFSTVVGCFVLYKQPNQFTFVLDWWSQFNMYVVLGVTGAKSFQKIGSLFGEGFLSKHNGKDGEVTKP